jgi:hypothetical protein
VLYSGEEVVVAWWSWVEGEMRSSKIDSGTWGGEAGDEEVDMSRGAKSRSGEEGGGGIGSERRR